MIKAIIFDFGGVIATEVYQPWLKNNIPNLYEKKEYLMDIDSKSDRGDISTQEYLNILSKESNKSPKQIEEEMINGFILNIEVVNLIKTLKSWYKIGLLSNFISGWMKYLLKKFELEDLFDAKVISTEHKMIKPDPAIFQLMLTMLKVKPKEAVFIDDKESNIKGAEEVGIKGILFTNAKDLKVCLKKLDINY